MKLNDSTLVRCTESNNNRGEKDYYVEIPVPICHALNISPGGAQAWLLFLDYGPAVKSMASRYRLIVFPFHPPNLKSLYRVRAKMENLPGAMFVVSWLLEELCCFNFLASTGIDSVDNFGMIDATCSLSGTKLLDRYAVDTLEPDHVSYFIYYLTKRLKTEASGILAHTTQSSLAAYLHRTANLALKEAVPDRTLGGKSTAFADAAATWLMFTQKHGETLRQSGGNPIDLLPVICPAPDPAAPTFLHFNRNGTRQVLHSAAVEWPLLRIEHSFSKEDRQVAEERSAQPWSIITCSCVNNCQDHYRLPIPADILGSLADYLPQDHNAPSDVAYAFDPASHSLSLHLKLRQEVHTRFVVTAKSSESSPTLAKVALKLFLHGADLRTLSSHRSGLKDHVEFTADMKSQADWLKLVDATFAGPLLLKRQHFGEFESIIVHRRPSACCLALTDINCRPSSDPNTPVQASAVKNATLSDMQKNFLLTPKQTIAQYRDKKSMLVLVRAGGRIAWAELSNIGRECDTFVREFSSRYRLAAPFGPIIVRALHAVLKATEGLTPTAEDMMKRSFSRAVVQMLTPLPEPAQLPHPAGSGMTNRRISKTNQEIATNIDVTFVKRLGGGQNGEVWQVNLSQPVVKDVERYALKLVDNTQAWEETGVNSSDVPQDTAPRYWAVSFNDNSDPAVLMELLAGHDLQKFIESRSHSITFSGALKLLLRTAELIEKWESANLIHWDIKPANLFLCDDGRLLLIDLGLVAKLHLDSNGNKSSGANIERAVKTSTEKFLSKFGTSYHIAPEIVDLRPTGSATPIYSWGALACCLLGDQGYLEPCGRPTAPIWIRDLLGSEFADTIAGCLNRSPEGRPQIADIKRVVQQVIDANLISDCLFLAECPTCKQCFDSSTEHCPNDNWALECPPGVPFRLDGRYRFMKRIGSGGCGVVYLAVDEASQLQVAVKLLSEDGVGKPGSAARFRMEADILKQLKNPHIVELYSRGCLSNGREYLIMEYVQGCDLARLIGRMESSRVADVFDQLLDGLSAAHNHGIIHRDLKPANVLVAECSVTSGAVKVADFGLAKLKEEQTAGVTPPTLSGNLVGTPVYMAPERKSGDEATRRSDIYSVGVMVIEALTGKVPYVIGSFCLGAASDEVRSLERILKKCTAADPKDRYSKVEEFHSGLVEAIRHYPSLSQECER